MVLTQTSRSLKRHDSADSFHCINTGRIPAGYNCVFGAFPSVRHQNGIWAIESTVGCRMVCSMPPAPSSATWLASLLECIEFIGKVGCPSNRKLHCFRGGGSSDLHSQKTQRVAASPAIHWVFHRTASDCAINHRDNRHDLRTHW